ncbi:phage tail protein, partial [Leuconostoc falkenbergense]|uniref:phage tail protein n=1 Tax=Leuconostoc falkenbergense TaxID=2766470 RepID=UPI0039E8E503
MITFKNISGNKFLAVGTIRRKSALNGEKSLTGTLYDGKDVLNKIDKGWSLEFDGEPYVVTYFERNDNDNSVSFDAIHKFFWDMAKKVLYSSTEINGSHTIKWYLDQIFANTGYTYALNFSPAAIEKDNWGNKTRLSLFNDLITSIAGEFEINGTLISIFQNIGTDLSTIVRYGFNLSDMTIENDATSFVTYGEGFGAYADQQNQTGDRVHVTYTSPLAGVYGILQAEPIDDQRYTSQANLQAAVKAQVDASFSVSVQLSLYDLIAAGYPYKMANVGDWLTAVDENLDFKQRIRIISIDDEFSADGTRISYTVTAGDVGLTKKYQDANASMASQVANAVASASQASTDANNALISANGKNTSYYLNSVDELPTTANEGDLAWVKSGYGTVMYIYTKKSDGSYYWEKRIDPEMGDQIAAGVTEAVAQANAHTEEVKQGLSSDIDTAKAQAASQASTAEANALNALTKEVADRQSAITALDTKATNAVNQAKSDINDTINAISVGGRNLLLNSKVLSWGVGNNTATTSTKVSYDSATNVWHITSPKGGSGNAGIYFSQTNNVSNIITKGQQWAFSFDIKGTGVYSQFGIEASSPFNKLSGNVPTDWTRVSSTGTATGTNSVIIYFNSVNVALDVYIKLPKLEIGTIPTDWSPAPEDVVLDYTTKDEQIKATITQYQTTNDGKVTKAQTDATTALGQVATKVSQADYDTKTGDLTTKYTQVKQTADSQATDIVSIKQKDSDQDAKMNSIVSDANGTKQTVSDLQITQGKQTGDISTLQQRADGFDLTVTKVDNLSIGGRNLLLVSSGLNTSSTSRPVLIGATSGGNTTITYPTDGVLMTNNQSGEWYYQLANAYTDITKTPLIAGQTYTLSLKALGTAPQVALRWGSKEISPYQGFSYTNINNTTWTKATITFTIPAGTLNVYLRIHGAMNNQSTSGFSGGETVKFKEVKLENGTLATDWTPAPEDVGSALAQVKITADSISNFVRDSSGNISSDFQTALSKTSIVTGSTLATSIQKQTATQITSALTDNNGKIISLINQDTSGVQIAGKNIILDGNVTVTNAFTVGQANIANGAIGTAQIGDAAITSAKIANLDVSKITGDVTNFVKSGWNNAY